MTKRNTRPFEDDFFEDDDRDDFRPRHVNEASREMQDRLAKSTPEDARELARKILRGEY